MDELLQLTVTTNNEVLQYTVYFSPSPCYILFSLQLFYVQYRTCAILLGQETKIQTHVEHDVKHTELKNAQMLSAQKNNIDCFLEKCI